MPAAIVLAISANTRSAKLLTRSLSIASSPAPDQPRSSARCRLLRKSLFRSGARFHGFHFAVSRRARCFERGEEPAGGAGDLINRAVECRLVGARGVGVSAQLAHELLRRCADLFFRRRRLEIKQRADVAAHGRLLSLTHAASVAWIERERNPGPAFVLLARSRHFASS